MTQTQDLSRRAFFKNASAAVALLASTKGGLEAFTYPLPGRGEQKTPAPAQPVVEITAGKGAGKALVKGSGQPPRRLRGPRLPVNMAWCFGDADAGISLKVRRGSVAVKILVLRARRLGTRKQISIPGFGS